MNEQKLRAIMVLKNVSVTDLCKVTGIPITNFWRRCKSDGYDEFKKKEIVAISKALDLSDSEMLDIFFSESSV